MVILIKEFQNTIKKIINMVKILLFKRRKEKTRKGNVRKEKGKGSRQG